MNLTATDFHILQTKVTPIVEGYGGWAFHAEIVPIESSCPSFGELLVSVILIVKFSPNEELLSSFSEKIPTIFAA